MIDFSFFICIPYCRNTKQLREFYEQLHVHNLIWQPRRNRQLSRNYTAHQNWIKNNLSQLITRSEKESVIKKTKTSLQRKVQAQVASKVDCIKHKRTYTNPSQILPKDWRGGEAPKDILRSHHHPEHKHWKKDITKENHMPIFDEHKWEKSQQNSNWIQQHMKDNTPWLSGMHPTFTRMVQHMQSNQCNTPHKQKESKKPHDYPNRCRKGIWQNSTFIHDKNFNQHWV